LVSPPKNKPPPRQHRPPPPSPEEIAVLAEGGHVETREEEKTPTPEEDVKKRGFTMKKEEKNSSRGEGRGAVVSKVGERGIPLLYGGGRKDQRADKGKGKYEGKSFLRDSSREKRGASRLSDGRIEKK